MPTTDCEHTEHNAKDEKEMGVGGGRGMGSRAEKKAAGGKKGFVAALPCPFPTAAHKHSPHFSHYAYAPPNSKF